MLGRISRRGRCPRCWPQLGVVDKKGSYYYFQEENFAQGRGMPRRTCRSMVELTGQDRDPYPREAGNLDDIPLEMSTSDEEDDNYVDDEA